MYPSEGKSWTRWTYQIRQAEFDGIMRRVPLDHNSTVLELGSGDGFQHQLLTQLFDRVFAIDPKNIPEQTGSFAFAFAFAEALPFHKHTFDLIVSNCVLEHLNDRRRGLEEAIRVLKPGGYMAHVVPARFWKAASLLLNPVGYPLRVWEKWRAMRQNANSGNAELPQFRQSARPGIAQVLARWVRPPIHGTYPSHVAEFRAYGRKQWAEEFVHPQIARVADEPLVCATQFGFLRFRFGTLRRWLGRHGLNSSRAFILRKIG